MDTDLAQQRVQDRLVDFGRPEGRRERGDVFLRTRLDLRREAVRVQAERGFETLVPEIDLARDVEGVPQFVDVLLRRKLRPLVEPFRRHQLGAGAYRNAPALHLD